MPPRLSTSFNNTGSTFFVDRLEFYNFGAFDVDVNYRTDRLGDRGPTQATRSLDGNTLTFDYDFPLVGSSITPNPLESSFFLSLNTNATEFSLDGRISAFIRYIGASGTETYRFDFDNIAVPIQAQVPIPAPILLFLSGLGLIVGARRQLAQ